MCSGRQGNSYTWQSNTWPDWWSLHPKSQSHAEMLRDTVRLVDGVLLLGYNRECTEMPLRGAQRTLPFPNRTVGHGTRAVRFV